MSGFAGTDVPTNPDMNGVYVPATDLQQCYVTVAPQQVRCAQGGVMIQFQALGGLSVIHDGEEIAVGGRRQRRLLAMLLIHRNTVVSVDRLTDAVFDGEPTPAAATTLRSYVARIRKVVELDGSTSGVVTKAPGYMLRVEGELFDVARFERLVSRDDPGSAATTPRRRRVCARRSPLAWRCLRRVRRRGLGPSRGAAPGRAPPGRLREPVRRRTGVRSRGRTRARDRGTRRRATVAGIPVRS